MQKNFLRQAWTNISKVTAFASSNGPIAPSLIFPLPTSKSGYRSRPPADAGSCCAH